MICRSLGLPSADADSIPEYGGGVGKIWFDHVVCKGDETEIRKCDLTVYTETADHACDHAEDLGVICQ